MTKCDLLEREIDAEKLVEESLNDLLIFD